MALASVSSSGLDSVAASGASEGSPARADCQGPLLAT